jgi:hypothetical protein
MAANRNRCVSCAEKMAEATLERIEKEGVTG